MKPFVHLSTLFCLYRALQNRKSKSTDLLEFHTSVKDGNLSRPAAFMVLIFVSTMLSSSVNYPFLMFNWLLIIFVIGLSMTFGEFPSRFLKCSFHICICSS